MGFLSVAEAAEQLGVSPARVRQRVADGSLPAEKVGGRWVVDATSLGAVQGAKAVRPLSRRIAWAVLDSLAGREPDVLSQERVRVRRYVQQLLDAQEPAPLARAWFPRRAERRRYRAAPADLADLSADERLTLSGVSDPASGIVASGMVEGYLAEVDVPDFVGDYFLVPAAQVGSENVVLHVAAREQPRVDFVWRTDVTLLADLAEYRGPREDERVRELVGELRQRLVAGT